MHASPLKAELAELESAEDFLNYFAVEFDQAVVHVNRLHILQRFHDYLKEAETTMPTDEAGERAAHADLLRRAYQDFVTSDARTEKVFKVFRRDEPKEVFIPLEHVLRRGT